MIHWSNGVTGVNILLTCGTVKGYSTFSDKYGIKLSDRLNVSSEFLHWFSGFTDGRRFMHDISKKVPKNNKKPCVTNTDLVVWGTNLVSTTGEGRFSKNIRDMIELPPYQYSVAIGLLLSDGWLTFGSTTSLNARLGFTQSRARFDYAWFVFSTLSHYCSNYPSLTTRKRAGNTVYGVQIFTRSLPCFTKVHKLFYVNNVKIIPNDIYNLLTPVALSHWIMGDGVFYKGKGIALCTDSNTIIDVVRLMNVLIIRYDLICTIHTRKEGQHRIYISQKSMRKLRTIVVAHMVSSMLYKVHI